MASLLHSRVEKKATTKDEMKYFEVPYNTGLRWQTIAKSVRELDEERIREAKEDIDTLLVFSGLFSAVLSAFLVDTYKGLQPDPQQEMIILLRQIVNQNYTMTSSSSFTITSYTPPADPSSTPIPSWAVRVNGLWFASLILSLATASIGMLVKSWLREYLALETEAPRERLRARYYREPAMQAWKVYEIAGLLPLLLQLALGLFFVGLCFFTAAIDHRIGVTSLPLVTGWAVFLLLTIVCPIFWVRCPFRIYALKNIVKIGRKLLLRFFSLVLAASRIPYNYDEDEEDKVIRRDDRDLDLLIAVDNVMADDSLMEAMWEVLKQLPGSDWDAILTFTEGVIMQRGGQLSKALVEQGSRYYPRIGMHSTSNSEASTQLRRANTERLISSFASFPPLESVWQPLLPYSPSYDALPDTFPDLRALSRRAYTSVMSITVDALTRMVYSPDSNYDRGIMLADMREDNDRATSPMFTSSYERNGNPSWLIRAILLLASNSHYSGSVLLNDSLIPPMCNVMRDFIGREQNVLHSTVAFVVRVIRARLGLESTSLISSMHSVMFDLSTLSRPAYMSLMGMTVTAIREDKKRNVGGHSISSPWIYQASLLLGAASPYILGRIINDDIVLAAFASFKTLQAEPRIVIQCLLRFMEHTKSIKLSNGHLVDVPSLEMVPLSTYQVLINLASDAILHYPAGGNDGHELWKIDACLLLISSPPPGYRTTERSHDVIQAICKAVEDDQNMDSPRLGWPNTIIFTQCLLQTWYKVHVLTEREFSDPPALYDVDSPTVYATLIRILAKAIKRSFTSTSSNISKKNRLTLVLDAYALLIADSPHTRTFELDDDLIAILCKSITQSSREPHETLTMVLKLVGRLLGLEHASIRELSQILDFSSLSKTAFSSITTVVGSVLCAELQSPLTSASPLWVKNATILLLSRFPGQLPEQAVSGLRISLDDTDSDVYAGSILADILSLWASHSANANTISLSGPLSLLYSDVGDTRMLDLEGTLRLYVTLIRSACIGVGIELPNRTLLLYPLLSTRTELFKNPTIKNILVDLFQIISPLLLAVSSQDPKLERQGVKHALAVMLAFGMRIGLGTHAKATQIFRSLWMTPSSSYYVMLLMACTSQYVRLGSTRKRILRDAFMGANIDAQIAILLSSINIMECFGRREYLQSETQIDVVRLCYIHLQLFAQCRRKSPRLVSEQSFIFSKISVERAEHNSNNRTRDAWTNLWHAITLALQVYWENNMWSSSYQEEYWHYVPNNSPSEDPFRLDCMMAGDCLTLISRILTADGKAADSYFPATLMEGLASWIPAERMNEFPEVKRIIELQKQLSTVTGFESETDELLREEPGWSGANEDADDDVDIEDYRILNIGTRTSPKPQHNLSHTSSAEYPTNSDITQGLGGTELSEERKPFHRLQAVPNGPANIFSSSSNQSQRDRLVRSGPARAKSVDSHARVYGAPFTRLSGLDTDALNRRRLPERRRSDGVLRGPGTWIKEAGAFNVV